jgi:uncharacterized Tic20 family protein
MKLLFPICIYVISAAGKESVKYRITTEKHSVKSMLIILVITIIYLTAGLLPGGSGFYAYIYKCEIRI